jgi:hypothetical protein
MRMRTSLVLGATLLIAAVVVAATTGIGPFGGDRPPGIPAELWHPLSPDLGLYVGPQTAQPRTLGPPRSVTGTLMARINGRWVAVQLAPDDGPFLIEEH